MKITNKLGLPALYVRAVSFDDYDPGESDTSATTLLKPPRAVVLSRKHSKELTEDAADRYWAFFGKMSHLAMERADIGDPNEIIEKRFYRDIHGWRVGAQLDLYEIAEKTITDNKFVSAYSFKAHKTGENTEWWVQTAIQTWIMRGNGYEVDRMQICANMRDWSKLQMMRDKDYPRHPVELIGWKPPSDEECEALVSELVLKHQKALKELPLCTDEECWKQPDKFAVMKEGRKSALRLLNTREEADEWIVKNNHGFFDEGIGQVSLNNKISIDHRIGDYTRCKAYCSVADFCTQHQDRLTEENDV